MKPRRAIRRKITDKIINGFATVSALLGIFVLGWILLEVGTRGIAALNWEFFTALPTPPGVAGGGMANAIVGTLIITALATVMGVPIGIMTGVYLAEVGKGTRLAAVVRFTINAMMGIPSIIIGLFIYTIVVLPMQHFSGIAGAFALAMIMLPVVAGTTEDMLNLVPNALRESALALGLPRWQVTFAVVFRAAKSGMITGVLLAVARVSGETAPLLFTALNSTYWLSSINEPVSNLTVTIFSYAMSPYADWQQAAWGASLLIMISVLLVTVFARSVFKEKKK